MIAGSTEIAPNGASPGQSAGLAAALDPVEVALAEALRGATAAGAWEVVAQLAKELSARREAGAASNVINIGARRRR